MISRETSIRPLQGADARPLHALVLSERQRLERWLPWVAEHETLDDAKRMVEAAQLQAAIGNGGHWGVWASGKLAGIVSLHWVSHEHMQAPIGYWVTSECEGKGVASAACSMLLTHAFGDLGLYRVELSCAVDNVRSRRLARRLGFCEEGVRRGAERLHGEFLDHVSYSLLLHEWSGIAESAASGAWLPG